MNYKSYQTLRDIAWEILIRNGVISLPVPIAPICHKEKIRLVSYSQAEPILRELDMTGFEDGNDAFTFGRMIFYNQERSYGRIRFAIAHELGHIFLHDTSSGTTCNHDPEPNDNRMETEANLFAARLLAPAIVLHNLNTRRPEQIADVCKISLQAAKFRADRLKKLEKRNRLFLETRGYSCFGMSSLERKVQKQFDRYIESRRQ